MAHIQGQDWTPVVLRNPNNVKKVTTVQKKDIKKPINPSNAKKFENDISTPASEEAPALAALPILTSTNRQLLIQSRVAKGMNQVKLANACNLNIQIIQDLETGKPVTDKSILQKINRALAINLKFN